MRPGHLEALAPVCPRCLHGRGVEAPIRLAETAATAEGHVLHGVLHCTDPACWLEFPIVDGVPVIVPDPRAVLAGAYADVAARADLPALSESLLDDVAGPGSPRLTARYHLSLYAHAHYADWSGTGPAAVAGLSDAVIALMGAGGGPMRSPRAWAGRWSGAI